MIKYLKIEYLNCERCGKEKTTREQRKYECCIECRRGSDRIKPYWTACIYCGKEKKGRLQQRSDKCLPCAGLLKRTTKHSNCEVCGVEKTTVATQRNSKCRSCRGKERKATGQGYKKPRTNTWWDSCVDCGVKKITKGEQENPRCRSCGGKHAKPKTYTKQEKRLKETISQHVRYALTGKKEGSAFTYLPFTLKELMAHIEKQFTPEMNWENRGTYWHIDHIVPISILRHDSLTHPNFQKCWSLENLRPLEARENISKQDKIIPEAQQLLEKWKCQEQKAQKAKRQ